MRPISLAGCLLCLAGCVVPQNSAQRLTEAALEMNTATRFGRMDVALDHVASKARDDFMSRHADWGTRIRVVDVEFGGFDMQRRDEAEVYLDVLWLRQDEATVRVTRIAQTWHDERGHWQLVREERKDGEAGLLGEPPARAPAANVEAASAGSAAMRPALGTGARVIRED